MSKEIKNVENKITLKLFAEGVGGLQRNGYDLVCPYIPPMQFKQMASDGKGGQVEQMAIQKAVCNTGCPLMKVNEDDTVEVCCGAVPVVYKIEKVIGIADKEASKDPKIIPFMGAGGKA